MESELTSDPEQAMDAAFQELHNVASAAVATLTSSVQNNSTRTLLSTIQGHMVDIRARIRDLEQYAEEMDNIEDTERLILKVSQRKREYESLQVELRKANLQMRKNAERAAVDERKALLGSPDPLERQRKMESEADLAAAAGDITASLRRTRQQMAQELEHTSTTLAAMEVSDASLLAAKDEFSGQKAGHRRSHKLLSTMRRHSVLDTLTLWGGLTMFLLAVVYIVTKRSLYFVPEFAKAPFRISQRNTNAVGKSSNATEVEPIPQKNPVTAIDLTAELDLPHTDEEGVGKVGELTTSADAAAGLQKSDLSALQPVQEEELEELQRAYEDRSKAAKQQQGAAHPGVWSGSAGITGMQMRARTASDPEGLTEPSEEKKYMANVSAPILGNQSNGTSDLPLPVNIILPPNKTGVGLEDSSEDVISTPVESTSQADQLLKEVADSQSAEDDEAPESVHTASELIEENEASSRSGTANVTVSSPSGTSADDVIADINNGSVAPNVDVTSAPQEILSEIGDDDPPETCLIDGDGEQCQAGPVEDSVESTPAAEEQWDESFEVDYLEPVTESHTELPKEAWMGSRGGTDGLEQPSPTTRQEDTELGIFRPDNL